MRLADRERKWRTKSIRFSTFGRWCLIRSKSTTPSNGMLLNMTSSLPTGCKSSTDTRNRQPRNKSSRPRSNEKLRREDRPFTLKMTVKRSSMRRSRSQTLLTPSFKRFGNWMVSAMTRSNSLSDPTSITRPSSKLVNPRVNQVASSSSPTTVNSSSRPCFRKNWISWSKSFRNISCILRPTRTQSLPGSMVSSK